MTGLTNYSSQADLNWLAGSITMPTLASRYLALFTGVGTDAGSGFTEVSGGSYARVQIAELLRRRDLFRLRRVDDHHAERLRLPLGCGRDDVYDLTAGKQIGTVLSWTGTTLTLTGNAANNGSGSTDSLAFSSFSAASGSAPSQMLRSNHLCAGDRVRGTALAFGIYDASSSGNLLARDYLGNYPWLPAYITSASPGIFDVKGNSYSAADPIVFSTEYGGTAPTFSQSNLTGVLAVVSPSGDTFQRHQRFDGRQYVIDRFRHGPQNPSSNPSRSIRSRRSRPRR